MSNGYGDMANRFNLDYEKERALKEIADEFDLELIILFGSRAKGYAREDSDCDVGVLRKEGLVPAERFLELAFRLTRALKMGDVDLVDLRRASPILKYAAASSAKVLYEAEPGAFTRFLLLAWKMYQDAKYDYLPYLDKYLTMRTGV